MSEFDKEAEREKLREKYADDDQKRAETRRMSELLLKGATMTNKHCGRCSDPLFRYDGQTFCPSCQAEGEAVQAEADAAQADADGAEPRTETAPEGQPSTPAGSQVDPSQAEPATQVDPQATAGGAGPGEASRSTQPQSGRPTQPQERVSPVTERQQKTNATSGVDGHTGSSTGDLTAARESLTRTVTRFAQEAERTDDPRRARELLTAAREAAATLAELE
ncbi:Sjogren syndrome/scleroderma autoantigen 1 (Autoantigen p27) [Halohasta litchfieldiae]|jgi:uncharacterized Zn finger protein (UPF0148 family)|uniref:Sjogren's syndrome/scleroderma autoantigen 1 (Autoantigen p27) n=1 Tax=Halohasta litchfieldiae TaxID=1073996 RepID=A0A1H6TE99_9EURY|nr:Sjogren's syndrome/scleroderma autoantigen 1 family protein [Halohasta litchfieldiae]ATW88798.1 Sjogren syndrome/scleroderma autoantigen 1 (Autoantigen p27) [Halohasta litchfieldiae]SEI78443.1 Sjogren's syndrome/scleroderma autoantigen 1 (Autoantigen p27) [Halohasta litchfieldiae]